MKDSGVQWIGMIPKEWNIHRLKSCVSDRESGAWGNDIAGDEGDVVCLRIADFDYRRYRFKELDNPVRRNYDKSTINRLALKKGDLLVEKSGGGDKTPVGRMVMFDKDYTALYANFMDRLRCRNFVNPNWFLYLWNTFYANGYVWNYIKQTTGLQNYDITSMLTEEKLALPSLPEQQRIASFLDCKCAAIDDVLAKTQESIEEYKKLKQSVITEAITKGVRSKRPMKDSGSVWFGKIPSDWNMVKFKHVVHIRKDIAGKEGYTVLSITQRGIFPKDLSKNEGQLANDYSNYQFVNVGDFAMNHMDLLTGWVDISKYNGVTSPDYRVFVLNDLKASYAKYYLYLVQMCYMDRIFYSLGQGVSGFGRWRLPADQFLNFLVAVPPYKEQKEIADYLDKRCAAIDTLIEKKQQFIEELTAYKKSLIYEYVTGKKEIYQE